MPTPTKFSYPTVPRPRLEPAPQPIPASKEPEPKRETGDKIVVIPESLNESVSLLTETVNKLKETIGFFVEQVPPAVQGNSYAIEGGMQLVAKRVEQMKSELVSTLVQLEGEPSKDLDELKKLRAMLSDLCSGMEKLNSKVSDLVDLELRDDTKEKPEKEEEDRCVSEQLSRFPDGRIKSITYIFQSGRKEVKEVVRDHTGSVIGSTRKVV